MSSFSRLAQTPLEARLQCGLHDRIALFNRYFACDPADGTVEPETAIAAASEFAQIMALVCDRLGVVRGPAMLSQTQNGVICQGHAESKRLERFLNETPELSAALTHMLHLAWSVQSMREYQVFLACYGEIFARRGREAAAMVSARFEASTCPAPKLMYDGHEIEVLFGSRPAALRTRELMRSLEESPLRQRTVDRYFPTFLARHTPDTDVPFIRGRRPEAAASC